VWGDPVELARRYVEQKADELVFLDISASTDDRATMTDVIRRVADEVTIPFCVGGGIASFSDFKRVLGAGADKVGIDKVGINTAAVKNPELIKEVAGAFGSEKIVVAIDCKRRFEGGDGMTAVKLEDGQSAWYDVVIYGGKELTGIDAIKWAQKMQDFGAGEILLTSKDRDGTKDGYDIPVTKAIAEAVDIPVIASGGVGTMDHIYDAFVCGADACLAASIFHYETYTVGEIKEYLRGRGMG